MSTLSRLSWLAKSPGGSEFTPTRTQSPSTTGPEIVQVLNANCERTQQAYAGSVVGVKASVVPNRDSGELDRHVPSIDFGAFDPQGLELLQLPVLGLEGSDIKSKLESIGLFLGGIYVSDNITQMSIHFLSFMKSFFKESFTESLQKIITDKFYSLFEFPLLPTGFIPQSDEFSFGNFLKNCRIILDDYSSVAGSLLCHKLQKFFGFIVVAGFFGTDPSLNICGYNLWEKKLKEKEFSFNAPNFLYVMLDTTLFLVESGYQCFSSGDPLEFFYGTGPAHSFEVEYRFIVSKQPMLITGTIDQIGVSSSEYENRLIKLIAIGVDLEKKCSNSMERNFLSRKILKLQEIQVQLISCVSGGRLRPKPYGILFYGQTSVGKSDLSMQTAAFLANSMNLPVGPEYVYNLNEADKFMSGFRSCHHTIMYDDMSNAQPAHIQYNPMANVIDIVNNFPKMSAQADISLKGVTPILAQIFIGSTNAKDLNASTYSVCPESILRRFDLHVTVTVKEPFCRKGTGMLDSSKIPLDMDILNVWELRVECVDAVFENGKTRPRHRVLNDAYGVPMEKVSIGEFFAYLGPASRAEAAIQERVVKASDRIYKLTLCPHDNFADHCKECQGVGVGLPPIMPEPLPVAPGRGQGGFGRGGFRRRLDPQGSNHYSWRQLTMMWFFFISLYVCKYLLVNISWSLYCRLFDFGMSYCGYPNHLSSIFKSTIYRLLLYLVCFILMLCYQPDKNIYGLMYFLCWLCFYLIVKLDWTKHVNRVLDLTSRHPRALEIVSEGVRKRLFPYAKWAPAVIAALITFKTFRTVKEYLAPQGARLPVPMEVEKVNVWTSKPKIIPAQTNSYSKTSSHSDIVSLLEEKLAYVEFDRSDGTRGGCGCFPLAKSFWILPSHMLKPGLTAQIHVKIDDDRMNVTRNFHATLDTNYVRDDDLDIIIAYLPQGGPLKNLLPLFPLNTPDLGDKCSLIFNDHGIERTVQSVAAVPYSFDVNYSSGPRTLKGFTYSVPDGSCKGMCMSPILTTGPAPFIMGLHIAGKGSVGAAVSITSTRLQKMCDELSARVPSVFEDVGFSSEMMGVETGPLGPNHPKSPVLFLPNGSHLWNHGSHKMARRHFKSRVQLTTISEEVSEIMKLPVKTGPPKNMNSWKPWFSHLLNLASPIHLLSHAVCSAAYDDFRKKIFSSDDFHNCLHMVHPVPLATALAGADGVYGIDALNLQTSSGWPFNRPKTDYIFFSDDPVEGITRPLELDEAILREIERIEQCFANGLRANTVFRNNLKDEATNLDKDKVRVFAGCPVAFSIVVRKYSLGICRLIMNNPKLFECAVGINCCGPAWTKMASDFLDNGEHFIAGDYKAFDSTMSVAMMLFAFQLFVDIAEASGSYDQRELMMLKGIATEICYPIYEYNGDYVQASGSNPSGQPLTVFVNNFVNSLYERYAFKVIYPSSDRLFHEYVVAYNFGDDNMMSVSDEAPLFNHTSMQKVLADVGITYTMADKLAESIPYVTFDECTFLKRRWRWDDELQHYAAPIAEDSIGKMLHTVVKSRVISPTQQSVEVIQCANLEYFQYGREIFNVRHEQLIDVAKQTGIFPLLGVGFKTYDEIFDQQLELQAKVA